MNVEPLSALETAARGGQLPARVVRRIRERMPRLREAIARVEKASGVPYPPHVIEPGITIAIGADMGISLLYCRTVPSPHEKGLSIIVSISAPFLLYASKGTLDAVVAHEFLHYLEFVRRFSSFRLHSLPSAATAFEAPYVDLSATLPAHRVLCDRSLVRLVARKFRPYLVDEPLARKVWAQWIQKGYPVSRIHMSENNVRIPVASILRTSFDQNVLNLLSRIGS